MHPFDSGSIDHPQLDWTEQGVPRARRFDDIYYSAQDGLAEARYVFLEGNTLPGRWQTRQHFVIGEIGFGTGLNFLATWQEWRCRAPSNAHLHYIAVERYPLSVAATQRALARWPELKVTAAELVNSLPPRIPGFHRLDLDGGRIILTLLYADAEAALSRLHARIDAWYLDGFAPAKNPDCWRPEIFRQMARLSAPAASVSTFTAAGQVRRDLVAVGFSIAKRPGFSGKREMLYGKKEQPSGRSLWKKQPWYQPPKPHSGEHKALVIGAGIAGCSLVYALSRRGWQLTLLERDNMPVQAASGNRAGIFMPVLSAGKDLMANFYLQGFLHTEQLLQRIDPQGRYWSACGVYHYASSAREAERFAKILAHRDLPRDLVQRADGLLADGSHTDTPGLYFHEGGWVAPARVANQMLQHAHLSVDCRYGKAVAKLQRHAAEWIALDESGKTLAKAPIVVFAGGVQTEQLAQTKGLSLRAARGQISCSDDLAQTIDHVWCASGYLTPRVEGQCVFGATYERGCLDLSVRCRDHVENLKHLGYLMPSTKLPNPESLTGRAAIRATTPDRLPLVGAAPKLDSYRNEYADLHHGRKANQYPTAPYYEGLYLLAGLGSRGMISAPLAASYLSDLITGTPSLLPKELMDAVHPGRFTVRELKRKRANPRKSPLDRE